MAKRTKRNRRAVSLLSSLLALVIAVVFYVGKEPIGNLWRSFTATESSKFDISQDFVRFLDVGQGDSILIYSNGRSMLLDTATANYGNEICYSLDACGIDELDVLMLSHLHSDHTGGVQRVCEDFKVKT